MRKINITITDADEAAIETIKKEFGIASRSAAIRFAVHHLAKMGRHTDAPSQRQQTDRLSDR